MTRIGCAIALMGLMVAQGALAEVEPEYEDGHLVLYFKGSGNPWSNTDWHYDAAFSSPARNFEDDWNIPSFKPLKRPHP